MLGTARPPYTSWTWRDLGVPIGGPQMIRLPDGRLVAGVRLYDKKVRTSLGWVDPVPATFRSSCRSPPAATPATPGWSGTTGCSGSATIPRTRARRASTWRRSGCRRIERAFRLQGGVDPPSERAPRLATRRTQSIILISGAIRRALRSPRVRHGSRQGHTRRQAFHSLQQFQPRIAHLRILGGRTTPSSVILPRLARPASVTRVPTRKSTSAFAGMPS